MNNNFTNVNEKILTNKKHGMPVLLSTLVLYIIAIACLIFGGIYEILPLIIVSAIYCCVGWIVLPGLKVLKPQEALVLTLFGKYIGTLKNEGFYFVNPFCHIKNR